MGTADLELIYDEGGVPIRAWKRMTLPETDAEDVRRFDLGQESATMKVKDQGGELHYYRFRGPRPSAIIAPGRGALSPWIRRAQLAVGDATREWVLDMRGIGGEEIREVTLRRDPDRDETGLGQVRVYTVYGRESVFTDANGFVIGDLSGLRPHASLTTDPPPAILMASPPDPVHTP